MQAYELALFSFTRKVLRTILLKEIYAESHKENTTFTGLSQRLRGYLNVHGVIVEYTDILC